MTEAKSIKLEKSDIISLSEFDAEIFHWDKKLGDTKIIEVTPALSIPEHFAKKKPGRPKYFQVVRIEKIADIIKFYLEYKNKNAKWLSIYEPEHFEKFREYVAEKEGDMPKCVTFENYDDSTFEEHYAKWLAKYCFEQILKWREIYG